MSQALETLQFTDIYIKADGTECFFRDNVAQKGLFGVPDAEIREEIKRLAASLQAAREAQNSDDFSMSFGNMVMRVSRMQTRSGIFYAARRLPQSVKKIAELGFAPGFAKELGDLGRSSGLILFSGPTGVGKSTLAASVLKGFLETYGNVAITVEDPPEMPLEGQFGSGRCFQIEVRNGDFTTPLIGALRKAPRYIFVGEVRHAETASEIVRAAVNGHIVITTIHAGTIEESIMALVRLAAGGSKQGMDLVWSILADGFLGAVNLSWPQGRIRPEAQMLLTSGNETDNTAIRSHIREGAPARLNDAIRQQETRRRIRSGS